MLNDIAENAGETSQATLPGLEFNDANVLGGKGYVERCLEHQVQRLYDAGNLDDRHAGTVALALVAARNVDSMGFVGKPSGRSMMIKAAKDVFELLPSPEIASNDSLDELRAMLMDS